MRHNQLDLIHKIDYDILNELIKEQDKKRIKLTEKEEKRKITLDKKRADSLLKARKAKEEKDRKEFERLSKKFSS
jgi:hypothetical protein